MSADLIAALKAGDIAKARAAVKRDAKSAAAPRAVLTAAGLASQDALELLVDHGAGRMTALHCCCASRMKAPGLFAIAKMLLDAGANPLALAKGWSHELDPLYFAAGSRQMDTFELLLDRGANADAALVHAMDGRRCIKRRRAETNACCAPSLAPAAIATGNPRTATHRAIS